MTDGNIEHWRGMVDQRIADHERRLLALNGNISKGADAINSLSLEVGKLATKVALYAAVGGFLASASSAIAVFFITHN